MSKLVVTHLGELTYVISGTEILHSINRLVDRWKIMVNIMRAERIGQLVGRLAK